MQQWLAPCLIISETGLVLLQRKVKIGNFENYPDRIPSLFTDKKYSNFGWIGKQFVACDYAFFVQTSFRMKKVTWINDIKTSQ